MCVKLGGQDGERWKEVLRFGFHRMGAESWGEVGGALNMDAPPLYCLPVGGTSSGFQTLWPAAVMLM